MSGARADSSLVRRFAYVPRPDGPHARLGVVWFLLACVACTLGTIAVAVLFAAVAAVAAMQSARTWADDGRRVAPIPAGVAAALAPLGATVGPIGFGVGAVACVVLLVATAPVLRSNPLVGLRVALVPAVAAGSIVLVGRTDMGALVVLLLLVSAYEIGDYLMGSEAGSVFEGPLSGMAAVMVLTFAEAVLQLGPFETRAAWIFGALVATLAPLGAPLASALVPTAASAGPALRRLDAWFLVAPVWALMLANYLDRIG